MLIWLLRKCIYIVMPVVILLASLQRIGHYYYFHDQEQFNLDKTRSNVGTSDAHVTALEQIKSIKQKETGKKKIIILSYMRSGSTFASKILEFMPGRVFMIFEPFWLIYKQTYRSKDKICTRTSECRYPTEKLESVKDLQKILKNLIDCNLASLPNEVLASLWYFHQGSSHLTLNRCHKMTPFSNKDKFFIATRQLKKYQKCIHRLENLCKKSDSVILKTIRLSLDLYPDVQNVIPDIKFVHLVRDPRAVFNSRAALNNSLYNELDERSKGLCKRLDSDLEVSLQKDPENIFVLRFECLAYDQGTTIGSIYNYLNTTVPEAVNTWLSQNTNSTSGEDNSGNPFGIENRNAPEIATKWIKSIPFEKLKTINKNCKSVLGRLQLKPIYNNTSDYWNSFISVCKKQRVI